MYNRMENGFTRTCAMHSAAIQWRHVYYLCTDKINVLWSRGLSALVDTRTI